MTLSELNSLPKDRASEELLKVCGAQEWARIMERARPFQSLAEAQRAAQAAWKRLSKESQLEAFAAHPRIGERSKSTWSTEEQRGVQGEEILKRIFDGNRAYEARFGHVFLICATGKGSTEILSALQTRITNTPEAEFKLACDEQAKIIDLRMEKLISP